MKIIVVLLCKYINIEFKSFFHCQGEFHLCFPSRRLCLSGLCWNKRWALQSPLVGCCWITLTSFDTKSLAQQLLTGVFPAKILSSQKVVSESSDLYITCSTTGSKKPSAAQGFIYLCKDGRVVRKKQQKPNQKDTFFIIRVGLHDGGNYSCVFSVRDLPLSTAVASSLNIIPIRVIGMDLHPPAPPRSAPPLMLSSALQPIFTQQIFRLLGRQLSRRETMWRSGVLFRTPCKRRVGASSSSPTLLKMAPWSSWRHSMLRGWKWNSPSRTSPWRILVITAAWCFLPNASKLLGRLSMEITEYFWKLKVRGYDGGGAIPVSWARSLFLITKSIAVHSRNVWPTENNIWSDYRIVSCGSGRLFH